MSAPRVPLVEPPLVGLSTPLVVDVALAVAFWEVAVVEVGTDEGGTPLGGGFVAKVGNVLGAAVVAGDLGLDDTARSSG